MNEIEFLKHLESRSELNRYNKRKLKQVEKREQKREQKQQERNEKRSLKEEEKMGVKMIEKMREDYKNANIHEISWDDDDIKQMCTDEYLSLRKIDELKKKNIFKISQLQQMKSMMEEDKMIDRIASADTIGPEWAKCIYDIIDLYEFPRSEKEKENVNSIMEYPKDIPSNVIIIEDDVDNKVYTSNSDTANVQEKEEYEKEDGKIDIEKFSENLVDEPNLADILLDIVLDLAQQEKSVGIIEFNPVTSKTERIGGSNIIFNREVLLVEHIFLRNAFNKAVEKSKVRLVGEYERDKDKYFMVALESVENYIKLSWKNGVKFYYTRRDYTGNKLNYVQFDIEAVTNRMNRKLSFDNCRKAAMKLLPPGTKVTNFVSEPEKKNEAHTNIQEPAKKSKVIPVNIKPYKEEHKMANNNNTIRLNPLKSSEYIPGVYVAAFEVQVKNNSASVADKFNFDNIGTDNSGEFITKGQVLYVFEKAQFKQGHYVIPKELNRYDGDIKYHIQQFYS